MKSFAFWCEEVETILNDEFGIVSEDVASETRMLDYWKSDETPINFVNAMQIKYDLIRISNV